MQKLLHIALLLLAWSGASEDKKALSLSIINGSRVCTNNLAKKVISDENQRKMAIVHPQAVVANCIPCIVNVPKARQKDFLMQCVVYTSHQYVYGHMTREADDQDEAMKKVFNQSTKKVNEWSLNCELSRINTAFVCTQKFARSVQRYLDKKEFNQCIENIDQRAQKCLEQSPQDQLSITKKCFKFVPIRTFQDDTKSNERECETCTKKLLHSSFAEKRADLGQKCIRHAQRKHKRWTKKMQEQIEQQKQEEKRRQREEKRILALAKKQERVEKLKKIIERRKKEERERNLEKYGRIFPRFKIKVVAACQPQYDSLKKKCADNFIQVVQDNDSSELENALLKECYVKAFLKFKRCKNAKK